MPSLTRKQQRQAERKARKAAELSQLSKSKRPAPFDFAIVRMGVPLALILPGVAFMITGGAWWGLSIFLLYLGLAAFGLDVFYEEWFGKLPRSIQKIVIVGFVVGLMASMWRVFVPASIKLYSYASKPSYTTGSMIHGIEWHDFSQVNLTISNLTPEDYDKFFGEISTNLDIAALQQVGGLGRCMTSTKQPHTEVSAQSFENGKPVGTPDVGSVVTGTRNGQKYECLIVPLVRGPQGYHAGPAPLGMDTTWEIRCDVLPAQTHLDFIAAIFPHDVARWVTLTASFEQLGRPRHLSFARCGTKTEVTLHDSSAGVCTIRQRFDGQRPFIQARAYVFDGIASIGALL